MDQWQALGTRFRAVRIKRGWRQVDVARRAGVSRTVVSRIELGQLESLPLGKLLLVGRALEIRTTILARAGGADLDRLVVARHAGLRESVAQWFAANLPDWVLTHEVSFAIYGERGVIDVLAWHAGRRALLIIELKTDVVDVDDILATMDRRRRLARRIALERGWDPTTVSVWVVVAAGRTNRRRLARVRTVVRTAFPLDGRSMSAWLQDPVASVAGLSLWHRAGADAPVDGLAARHRVSVRRSPV